MKVRNGYVFEVPAMPQATLKPETGAQFVGKIEHLIGERLFRASCYAELREGVNLQRDTPKFWMCATEAAARKWIEVQAAQRGFPGYSVLEANMRGVDRLGREVGQDAVRER